MASRFDAPNKTNITGRLWPLVAGHDRQLSYWIFYTSTNCNWHVAELYVYILIAGKLPLTNRSYWLEHD